MDSKRKVNQVFNSSSQGSLLKRRPPPPKKKTRSGIMYKEILINSKLQIGRRRQKIETDWEKSIKEAKVRIGP